jgi:hypothetical protein
VSPRKQPEIPELYYIKTRYVNYVKIYSTSIESGWKKITSYPPTKLSGREGIMYLMADILRTERPAFDRFERPDLSCINVWGNKSRHVEVGGAAY